MGHGPERALRRGDPVLNGLPCSSLVSRHGAFMPCFLAGLMIMWTYSASKSKDASCASCASCSCACIVSTRAASDFLEASFNEEWRITKEQLSRHSFHSLSWICNIFLSPQDTDVIELFGPFEGKTVARTLTGLGVVLLIFGTSSSALILGHSTPFWAVTCTTITTMAFAI